MAVRMVTVLAGLARELVAAFARSLPDYILKGFGALLRWYLRLRLASMFAVTRALAVGVVTASSALGLPPRIQEVIYRDLAPTLVLGLLAVILFGVIRSERR
jgi:hypothetical protein